MSVADAGHGTAAEPFLTLVIPVHHGEKWIAATLDSIAAESAPDLEVIVVDGTPDNADGSSNQASADIVRTYADRLALDLVRRPDLDNLRTKVNFAIERARAPHVSLICQDDLWLPGRLAATRRWIAAAPDAALHVGPVQIVDQDARPLGKLRCPLPTDVPSPKELLVERLLVQNFICAPAAVFRRDHWLAAGGLEVDLWYTGDWDLYFKLADLGAVYYHPEVTAAFRIHGGALTITGSRDPADFEAQMRVVLNRHLPRLAPELAEPVTRAADASIKINVALAAASDGSLAALARAALHLLSLGPRGLHRYLRDSRLFDRAFPRLRARLTGAL
jgi:glycosyltransferase involved in cell wall biosynthesis